MTAICKFICACNVTLSARTYRFREKRERANLPYTENRDMVKISNFGSEVQHVDSNFHFITGEVLLYVFGTEYDLLEA